MMENLVLYLPLMDLQVARTDVTDTCTLNS